MNNISAGIITREEALKISPDYVAYAEGDHDKWQTVFDQFEKVKVRKAALTATTVKGKLVFIRVKIASVNHDDIRAVDGPVVRVSNGEYSWRVDGDKYAFPLP